MKKGKNPLLVENINLDEIKTVCLALGPYRNLTTLTASILALHPNCQVLNHAGDRTLGNKDLNIFYNYSNENFDDFVRYAIGESVGGQKGQYGGSIVLSHAFDPHHKIAELYKKRYGNRLLKDDVRCLFWKESLRTANYIKNNGVDLGAIFSCNDKIKFLLPIRNPLDCAKSNMKTGHVNLFQGLSQPATVEEILIAIFGEYLWFLELKSKYPSRFFYFFEHEFGLKTLKDLSCFLGLAVDEQWCKASLEGFVVKSPYQHTSTLEAYYKRCVKEQFSNYPEFQEKLLLFLDH